MSQEHKRITRRDREVDRWNLRETQQFREEEEPETKQELKEGHNDESIEPTIRAAEERREQ